MDYLSIKFPPPEKAGLDGLLAISAEINPAMLHAAYSNGIFPWPENDRYIPWFSPPERVILELAHVRISQKLLREFKHRDFNFKINTDFEQVIGQCSKLRRESGTWITDKIISAYTQFHRDGFAFSFETWSGKDRLVGGLYGVWINGFFAGESMFHLESGASKFALIQTITFLRDIAGIEWIDVQMSTPLMARLGARSIERKEYMDKLRMALARPSGQAAAGVLNQQKGNTA